MFPALSWMVAAIGVTLCLYVILRASEHVGSDSVARGALAGLVVGVALIAIVVILYLAAGIHDTAQRGSEALGELIDSL